MLLPRTFVKYLLLRIIEILNNRIPRRPDSMLEYDLLGIEDLKGDVIAYLSRSGGEVQGVAKPCRRLIAMMYFLKSQQIAREFMISTSRSLAFVSYIAIGI